MSSDLSVFNRITDGWIGKETIVSDVVPVVLVERLQQARYAQMIQKMSKDLPFAVTKMDAKAVFQFLYRPAEFKALPVDIRSNAMKASRALGLDMIPETAWGWTGKTIDQARTGSQLSKVTVDGTEVWLPSWMAKEVRSANNSGIRMKVNKGWQKKDLLPHNWEAWRWFNRFEKIHMTHGFFPFIRLDYFLTNGLGLLEMPFLKQGPVGAMKTYGRVAGSVIGGTLSKVTPMNAPVLTELLRRITDLENGVPVAPFNRVHRFKSGDMYDLDRLAEEMLRRGVTDTYSHLIGKDSSVLEMRRAIKDEAMRQTRPPTDVFAEVAGQVVTPAHYLDMWRQANDAFNDGLRRVEANFRSAQFLNSLDEGKSIAEAADVARKSQFDFGDLTHFEKSVAKQYVQFYTFFRRQASVLVRAFLENPARITAFNKLLMRQPQFHGIGKEEQAGISGYNLQGVWVDRGLPSRDTPSGMRKAIYATINTTGPITVDVPTSIATSMFDFASQDEGISVGLERDIGSKAAPGIKLVWELGALLFNRGEEDPKRSVPRWVGDVFPGYTKQVPATKRSNPDYTYYTSDGEPYTIEAEPWLKWIVEHLGSTPRQIQKYADQWDIAQGGMRAPRTFGARNMATRPFSVLTDERQKALNAEALKRELKEIEKETKDTIPRREP